MTKKLPLNLDVNEIKTILDESNKPANRAAREALPHDTLFTELQTTLSSVADSSPNLRFSFFLEYADVQFIHQLMQHCHHDEHQDLKDYLAVRLLQHDEVIRRR